MNIRHDLLQVMFIYPGSFHLPNKPQVPNGAFHAGDIGNIPCTPGGYANLEISKAEVHPLVVKTTVITWPTLSLETPLNAMLIAAKDLFSAH
jgi:hypothetical protein